MGVCCSWLKPEGSPTRESENEASDLQHKAQELSKVQPASRAAKEHDGPQARVSALLSLTASSPPPHSDSYQISTEPCSTSSAASMQAAGSSFGYSNHQHIQGQSSLPFLHELEMSELPDQRGPTLVTMLVTGGLVPVQGEVPAVLQPVTQLLVQLYQLQLRALYNDENGRRFIRRCCLVQEVVMGNQVLWGAAALLAQLREVLEEAVDLMTQFSGRGWLTRLLDSPDDVDDFLHLDQQLVEVLLAHLPQELLTTSLRQKLIAVPQYSTKYKNLCNVVADVGGVSGLSQDLMLSLHIAEYIKAANASVEDLVSAELVAYEDEHEVGPHSALRHLDLRSCWRRSFPGRELVSWPDFWHWFPRNLPSPLSSDLSELLNTRSNRDAMVQTIYDRGTPDMPGTVDLDFLFPPGIPLLQRVRQLISMGKQEGRRTSNLQSSLPPVHLYGFPEEGEQLLGRDVMLQTLELSVQDVTTNLLVLVGPPGSGKAALAHALASRLVLSGVWQEAYHVNLAGITSHLVAGLQLMASMGLSSDSGDLQAVISFLERRSEGMIAIVVSGAEELLAHSEEQHNFIHLLDRMLSTTKRLRVIITAQDRLQGVIRQNMLSHNVPPVSTAAAVELLALLLPHLDTARLEQLTEIIGQLPMALRIVGLVLQHGDIEVDELLRLLRLPALPHIPLPDAYQEHMDVDRSRTRDRVQEEERQLHRDQQEKLYRAITAALLALPEELCNAAMVLALFQGHFSAVMACELLSLQDSTTQRRLMLRRLVRRRLLSFNSRQEVYIMPRAVRRVAAALAVQLGLGYVGAKQQYVRLICDHMGKAVALWKRGFRLSAMRLWDRCESCIAQVVEWGLGEFPEELLPAYRAIIWDMMPLLEMRVQPATLQNLCSSVLQRAVTFKRPTEEAQASTQLAYLLQANPTQIDAAEGYALRGRDAFISLYGEEDERTGRAYEVLASIMLKLNKVIDAHQQLLKALEIKEDCGDIERVSTLHLLGDAVLRMGMKAEAEARLREALALQKQRYATDGPLHPEVATTLVSLAYFLQSNKRMGEAEQLYKEALEHLRSGLGQEHQRVAGIWIQLGSLELFLGRFLEAQHSFKSALHIRERVLGRKHPDTAVALSQLAMTLRNLGKPNDARIHAQRCLDIQESVLDPAHPEVAYALQHLAELMLDLGKYDDAEMYCGRSIAILEQQPAPNPTRMVGALNLLALTMRLLGNAQQAEHKCQQCIQLARQVMDRDHPNLASCFNCNAEVLRDLGKLPEAEENCRRGLQIREAAFGKEHLAVALSLNTLASILRLQRKLDEAKAAALRCIEIRMKVHGHDNFLLARAQQTLSTILADSGDLVGAEEAVRRSLEIQGSTLGSRHPEVANSLVVLAEILLTPRMGLNGQLKSLSDDVVAIKTVWGYLSKAVQIYESVRLMPQHPQFQRARRAQEQLQQMLPRSGSIPHGASPSERSLASPTTLSRASSRPYLDSQLSAGPLHSMDSDAANYAAELAALHPAPAYSGGDSSRLARRMG